MTNSGTFEQLARMRNEKARHEIRIQKGTGEWNLGNIEHILKHETGE